MLYIFLCEFSRKTNEENEVNHFEAKCMKVHINWGLFDGHEIVLFAHSFRFIRIQMYAMNSNVGHKEWNSYLISASIKHKSIRALATHDSE